MGHRYFVYILTNRHHTALYVGVTNDLVRRVHEHRTKIASTFTTRYNVDKLVFFEETERCTCSNCAREADQGWLSSEEDCACQRHQP